MLVWPDLAGGGGDVVSVELTTRRGSLPGYLARPAGAGPWPAVVLVFDVFGLSDDTRAQADRFAAEGYLALAPDFYAHGLKIACVLSAFRQLSARRGRFFEEIEAARAYLTGRDDCSGRVGVIGYCMGGAFALLAAPRFPFGAASVNYGVVPDDAERLLAGACPIVATFGGHDKRLRGHPERLERALSALGVPHDVREYPDAGHGFLNRHDGPLVWALGRVAGAGYHAPSAADAWRRILAFFGTYLER
jgi:carboxymethylenebutenolidase